MQNSRISHQPKNGREPRASAMRKTDASGTPIQWPVSWGRLPKAECPLSTQNYRKLVNATSTPQLRFARRLLNKASSARYPMFASYRLHRTAIARRRFRTNRGLPAVCRTGLPRGGGGGAEPCPACHKRWAAETRSIRITRVAIHSGPCQRAGSERINAPGRIDHIKIPSPIPAAVAQRILVRCCFAACTCSIPRRS